MIRHVFLQLPKLTDLVLRTLLESTYSAERERYFRMLFPKIPMHDTIAVYYATTPGGTVRDLLYHATPQSLADTRHSFTSLCPIIAVLPDFARFNFIDMFFNRMLRDGDKLLGPDGVINNARVSPSGYFFEVI
jgi:hypothetical protein